MAKIGNVKASCEQELDGKLMLTIEEVNELEVLLADAKNKVGKTSDKWVGVVAVECSEDRISVSTGRVKADSAE